MSSYHLYTIWHRWSLFFFSSRRRHTRWPRDWSSDVCSSDLAPQAQYLPSQPRRFERDVERPFTRDLACGLARLLDQFVRPINSGFGFRRARFRAAPQPFELAPRHLFQPLRFDRLTLLLLLFFFEVVAVIAGEGLYPAAINFEHAV